MKTFHPICDGCSSAIDRAEANYVGPELPLWEGATLCNECYARERDTALEDLTIDWKPWKFEKCCVCNGGFSEKSWDNRHTHPHTGGDCHARCCPWCKND